MVERRSRHEPRLKRRGLQLGASRYKRLHDGSPGNILGGVPISVLGMTALDTTEGGLTLAVGFLTMAAH